VSRIGSLALESNRKARATGAKLLIHRRGDHRDDEERQWELTATKSLAGLAGCPELVSLGHGIPDLMRQEFQTGAPAQRLIRFRDAWAGS